MKLKTNNWVDDVTTKLVIINHYNGKHRQGFGHNQGGLHPPRVRVPRDHCDLASDVLQRQPGVLVLSYAYYIVNLRGRFYTDDQRKSRMEMVSLLKSTFLLFYCLFFFYMF